MNKLKLIVMSGLQGSGKSTIAEELARQLKIPILSVDPIHSAIFEAGIPDSFEVGLADYLVAQRLADQNLSYGISVIIDASNYVAEAHKMWNNLAEKHNIKPKVIECRLDEKLHKDRISKRVRNISGIQEVKWDDVAKRMNKAVEWKIEKLVVNTKLPVEKNILKAINYIKD